MKSIARYKKKFGIIGGGQLGKMICHCASLLGFETLIYSDIANACAVNYCDKSYIASFDSEKLLDFCNECDFITTEFENINLLPILNSKFCDNKSQFFLQNFANIYSIFISQNRLREKTLAQNLKILTPHFKAILSKNDLIEFQARHNNCIVKTTTMGYDGKGQFVIKNKQDIDKIPSEYFELKNKSLLNDSNFKYFIKQNCNNFENIYDLDLSEVFLIAESFVDYKLEFSVVLTRFKNNNVVFFPIGQNIHKNGILQESIIKNNIIDDNIITKAQNQAKLISQSIDFVGTMAVEFFLTNNNDVIFNEIAPRPHNSAHYSMDLCNISQFESHVRAVADLPSITPKLIHQGKMINLLGEDTFELVDKFINNQNAKIHLYGKTIDINKSISNRKLGHINVIESN